MRAQGWSALGRSAARAAVVRNRMPRLVAIAVNRAGRGADVLVAETGNPRGTRKQWLVSSMMPVWWSCPLWTSAFRTRAVRLNL